MRSFCCLHICIVMACFFSVGIKAQKFYNTEIAAKIEIVESNGLYLITANGSNLTELNKSVKYKFSIIKRDGTDTPKKEEVEGLYVIAPSNKVRFNNYSIPVAQSKDILVLLLVYDGDSLIGKDRIIIDEIKDGISSVGDGNVLSQALNSGEEIGIKGLIIEDTKTKAGRDFYRLFFQKCDIANISWSKDVLVKEDFGLGRSTVLKVIEGTKTIIQFNAQPKDDFLSQAADECIRLVQKHFNELSKTNQLLTSY